MTTFEAPRLCILPFLACFTIGSHVVSRNNLHEIFLKANGPQNGFGIDFASFLETLRKNSALGRYLEAVDRLVREETLQPNHANREKLLRESKLQTMFNEQECHQVARCLLENEFTDVLGGEALGNGVFTEFWRWEEKFDKESFAQVQYLGKN